MQRKLKNLFIGLGPGYHHQVRIMHSMVKEKCDSSMLFFHIEKNVDSIGDDLRFHYSMGYKDFPKTFDIIIPTMYRKSIVNIKPRVYSSAFLE